MEDDTRRLGAIHRDIRDAQECDGTDGEVLEILARLTREMLLLRLEMEAAEWRRWASTEEEWWPPGPSPDEPHFH